MNRRWGGVWVAGFAAAMLAGCDTLENGTRYANMLTLTNARTSSYDKLAGSWTGATEGDLISAWGRPTRIVQQGDSRQLVYSNANSELLLRPRPTFMWFFTNVVETPSGNAEMLRLYYNPNCETTFEVVDNRVKGWRSSGPGCVSTVY